MEGAVQHLNCAPMFAKFSTLRDSKLQNVHPLAFPACPAKRLLWAPQQDASNKMQEPQTSYEELVTQGSKRYSSSSPHLCFTFSSSDISQQWFCGMVQTAVSLLALACFWRPDSPAFSMILWDICYPCSNPAKRLWGATWRKGAFSNFRFTSVHSTEEKNSNSLNTSWLLQCSISFQPFPSRFNMQILTFRD